MVCFFRDLHTWAHLMQRTAADWSVPVFAASDKTGSVKVDGEWPELCRCWCILAGRVFYASKATPSGGMTTVTLRRPVYAFGRDLVYDDTVYSTGLEDYIEAVLASDFVSETDTAFAMPYLTVTASGATAAELAYIDGEVYDFADVIALAEELGVGFTFTASASGLAVAIAPRSPAAHNLFFNDGSAVLTSASLSRDLVTRVTVRRVEATEEQITETEREDYYWHQDGSITTTAPSPRISGTWKIVSVTDADTALSDAAAEAMAKNNASWKIVFQSRSLYALGDKLTCLIYGEPVTAAVTSCTAARNTDLYTYELGDMPTTLTEKLRAENAKKQAESVTLEGQEDLAVPATGGTMSGALTVNDEVYASMLKVGTSSYGSTLPGTGKAGQVFFKI